MTTLRPNADEVIRSAFTILVTIDDKSPASPSNVGTLEAKTVPEVSAMSVNTSEAASAVSSDRMTRAEAPSRPSNEIVGVPSAASNNVCALLSVPVRRVSPSAFTSTVVAPSIASNSRSVAAVPVTSIV